MPLYITMILALVHTNTVPLLRPTSYLSLPREPLDSHMLLRLPVFQRNASGHTLRTSKLLLRYLFIIRYMLGPRL